MKIGGLQKFSLLDYPKELSAIVFTQGCNFRCPYCHNPELVLPNLYGEPLSNEEVLRFLYRRRQKLTAVVVTGGEPTLQEDLLIFLKILKAMHYKVKLDTNGSRPETLKELIEEEVVDYFAMDLKASLDEYPRMCRCDISKDAIEKSMELIRYSGVPYEFRTTVAQELLFEGDLFKIRRMLKPNDRYYLQNCNYTTTLDDLQVLNLPRFNFSANTEYLALKDWAKENNVDIALRGKNQS